MEFKAFIHAFVQLPVQVVRTSRRIVPGLKRAGYAVEYQEFDGGHTVPPDIARQAVDWFLAR